jgi:hypothetical protein
MITLEMTRTRPTASLNRWPRLARNQHQAAIDDLGKALDDKLDFHIVRGKAVGLVERAR